MNKLPFHVIVFDICDEQTSHCMFPTERAARKKYEKAVVSAPCANVGRVQLTCVTIPSLGFSNVKVMEEWTRETEKPMDVQTAGYIVHSARSVNGKATTCKSVNKTFHETEDDAVQAARKLADTWKLGHEGLIVFKAIKHVQKVKWTPRPGIQIRVFDV